MSNHNSGLSDETIETIRKFDLEQKRSNRSSRNKSCRLIDEIQQSLLSESNGGGSANQLGLGDTHKTDLKTSILFQEPLLRQDSIIEEELETCQVCYCDYQKEEMFALQCNHSFCENCIKAHLKNLIESGRAIKITCMESGCPEEFKAVEVERFCTKESIEVYKTIV